MVVSLTDCKSSLYELMRGFLWMHGMGETVKFNLYHYNFKKRNISETLAAGYAAQKLLNIAQWIIHRLLIRDH